MKLANHEDLMNKLDYYVLSSISVYLISIAFNAKSWGHTVLSFLNLSDTLITPVIFVALYHACIYTYNKYLFKIVHHEEYLGGTWIYRIHNAKNDCKLYGIFTVEHNIFGIKLFFGKVWNNTPHGDNDILRGVWIGETIHYKDKRLQFVFDHSTLTKLPATESSAPRDFSSINGIAILDFYNKKDTSEMNGIYYDIDDSNVSNGKWESRKVNVASADAHRKAAYNFRYPDH